MKKVIIEGLIGKVEIFRTEQALFRNDKKQLFGRRKGMIGDSVEGRNRNFKKRTIVT